MVTVFARRKRRAATEFDLKVSARSALSSFNPGSRYGGSNNHHCIAALSIKLWCISPPSALKPPGDNLFRLIRPANGKLQQPFLLLQLSADTFSWERTGSSISVLFVYQEIIFPLTRSCLQNVLKGEIQAWVFTPQAHTMSRSVVHHQH